MFVTTQSFLCPVCCGSTTIRGGRHNTDGKYIRYRRCDCGYEFATSQKGQEPEQIFVKRKPNLAGLRKSFILGIYLDLKYNEGVSEDVRELGDRIRQMEEGG